MAYASKFQSVVINQIQTRFVSFGCLLLASLGHPFSEQPRAAETGTATLAGVIQYRPDAESPWRFQRYYVADPTKGELAEAVVALKPHTPFATPFAPGTSKVTVDQENFQFIPETVAVQIGDTVAFTNSDETLHNVMLTHPKDAFNVNLAKGEIYEHQFKNAVETMKPHRLGCVYHGSMRGWVFVFDHPYFAITKKDGRYAMKHIPSGKYDLEVYHPAGRLVSTQTIEITKGTSHHKNIVISPANLKTRTRKTENP